MKKLLISIIASFCTLGPLGAAVMVQSQRIDLTQSQRAWITPLNLEHATTAKELGWGLMGRKSLPDDFGMTFTFPDKQKQKIWMFNCFVNLSVAFLDDNHVIREIYDLDAYPSKMDPNRPVNSMEDVNRYRYSDPTIKFFSEKSITSKYPTHLAIEVSKGWFINHDVHIGDVVVWHKESDRGFVIHTLNLDLFHPTEEAPIMIEFTGKTPHSVWRPMSQKEVDVAFLNDSFEVMNETSLAAGARLPSTEKNVVVSQGLAKYCLITPKGWLDRHLLHGGVTVDLGYLLDNSVER